MSATDRPRATRATAPTRRRRTTLRRTASTPATNGVAHLGASGAPTIQDIQRAQEIVRPHVYQTPLLPSRTLSAMSGSTVWLKLENLQRSGAYKIRGATYKLSLLSEAERARGVIAASAGNHAQGSPSPPPRLVSPAPS
jgi:threonine dehydratase